MQLLNVQEPHTSQIFHGLWWGLVLLSGKPVVPLKPMNWLQIHTGMRCFWVKNKGEALQGAPQDNLIWASLWKEIPCQARSSNSGEKHLAPHRSAQLGRCSKLSNVWPSMEKTPPSLVLFSCSASIPLSGAVSWRRRLCLSGATGMGSAGQHGRDCVAALDPVLCLSFPDQGAGEWRARSKWDWGKGFSKGVAFLLQTNSIRNT